MNKRALIVILGVVGIAVVLVLLANLGGENEIADPTPGLPTLPVPTAPDDAFSQYPVEARTATRPGDPRSPAYWALWNTCAPENRADVAEANGGREAGWFLMDDLIADPGIQLGDLRIESCQQGLALLEGHSTDGEEVSGDVYQLAGQLLAAELNLNVGAESCPIAEEAVIGSHIILANLGFNGTDTYDGALSDDLVDSLVTFLDLLTGYNRGELCIN